MVHITAADFLSGFAEVSDGVANWRAWLDRDREFLRPVSSSSDLDDLETDRRIRIILGLQNASPVEAQIERVESLWQMGVRVLQLTYNEGNLIGDGCLEPRNAPLTEFGRQVVEKCNQSGMVIDLSHVGERSALDAVEHSAAPVVITHANIYEISKNPRNKTREVISAVCGRGGVVGISPYAPLCWDGSDGRQPPSFEAFFAHLNAALELVGEDSVAIGTDLPSLPPVDGANEIVARSNARYPEIFGDFVEAFGPSVSARYVDQMSSLVDWKRLPVLLSERGVPDAVVAKVVGENWIRVFKKIWGERQNEW